MRGYLNDSGSLVPQRASDLQSSPVLKCSYSSLSSYLTL